VDALIAGLNDPDVARFMTLIPYPYARADADAWIAQCEQVWKDGRSQPFAITERAEGELIGGIEVTPRGSVGYWLAAPRRGHGIATRALCLVCAAHAGEPLWLTTHPKNVASQRVAEKAGFRRAGTTPQDPPFRDGTSEAVEFRFG
jgi:RimJ/RimL family protein N-acetyltransferase